MNSLRSRNCQPTHLGEILREDVLPELDLSVSEFAQCLGVPRSTLEDILHERSAATPDMAIRLARFFDTSVHSWLAMQQTLDVWKLERERATNYAMIQRVG